MLLPSTNANRNHIAGCSVEYSIRGGSQQQGDSVSPVAPDDDGIYLPTFRNPVDFALGPAEDQVPPFRQHIEVLTEFGEVRFCLLVNLVLYG